MDCPKCNIGKLNKVTISFQTKYAKEPSEDKDLIQELELDQCFVCNGVWFDGGELEKYLKPGLTIVNSRPIDRELMKEFDKKITKCPKCNIEMVKKHAPKNPKIIIDFCKQCKGVWLDSTEIDKIEQKNIDLISKIMLWIKSLIR